MSFMGKFNPDRDDERVLVIMVPFTSFISSVACAECIAIEIQLSCLRKSKVWNPLVFYNTYVTAALQLYCRLGELTSKSSVYHLQINY